MTYHTTFLLILLVSVPQYVSAQTPPSTPVEAKSHAVASENIQICLEMRWLTLNDNSFERLGISPQKLPSMPKPSSWTICDELQAEMLSNLAKGDKRSQFKLTPTAILQNRGKCEFLPPWSSASAEGNDAVQVTVSNDRQAIQIELTWAKWKDGRERLPIMNTAVPVGSHLLVHTGEYLLVRTSEYTPLSHTTVPRSCWNQLLTPLFGKKPNSKQIGIGSERQERFLLLSPRIALQSEIVNLPATK